MAHRNCPSENGKGNHRSLWWGFLWALSRRLVNTKTTNQPRWRNWNRKQAWQRDNAQCVRWRRKRRSISNNIICSRHAKNVAARFNWKKHEILVKRKRNFYKSILDSIGSFTLLVINVTPPWYRIYWRNYNETNEGWWCVLSLSVTVKVVLQYLF